MYKYCYWDSSTFNANSILSTAGLLIAWAQQQRTQSAVQNPGFVHEWLKAFDSCCSAYTAYIANSWQRVPASWTCFTSWLFFTGLRNTLFLKIILCFKRTIDSPPGNKKYFSKSKGKPGKTLFQIYLIRFKTHSDYISLWPRLKSSYQCHWALR